MIIKENVIKDLRAGKKEALEEVFNTYQPLYHFLYAQIIFDEKSVNKQLILFYQEMYEKIITLSDDFNFEKWSIRLLLKHAKNYLSTKEDLKGLNDDEIHDILKDKYPVSPIIKYLDDDQDFIGVLAVLFNLPSSFIGETFSYSRWDVISTKKNVITVLKNLYANEYFEEYKKVFLSRFDGGLAFEDIANVITFKNRSEHAKNKISGPLKTVLVVLVVAIVIISIFWLISDLKGNNITESRLF